MSESTLHTVIRFCIVLLVPAAAAAQRVEVGVHGGYFLPAVEQFERAVVRTTSTGFRVDRYDGRHNSGVAISVDLTAWPLSHFGLDLAGAFRFCERSGSSPFVIDPFLPVPAGSRAALSILSLRLIGRTRLGPTTLRLGAGPALVHLGGSAYDGGTPEISLARRTFGGGTIFADVTRIIGRLRVRFGVEDALYGVTMAQLPPGDTTRTPLQHDLALTAGFAVVLR